MASPVKEAKAKHIASGFTEVVERGKGSLKSKKPGVEQYALTTQVGNAGWHFGDGPFTDAHEVDTAWVNADPILDAPWQKKMVLADYNAYAFREATLGFDQGQLIEYRDPVSGEYVNFQPTQLQWTNDLGQLSPIADPQAVAASVVGDTLRWNGAYGPGLDFEWHNDTVRLIKFLHVDALASLPAPPAFIIAGGNPVLKITLLFQRSANVRPWVDGVLWNEKSNNPQTTLSNIEFRDTSTGAVRWVFKAPVAFQTSIDPLGEPVTEDPPPVSTNLTMKLRATAQNLFVDIVTPWAWLETANYPVKIDATVDAQVGASADDAWQDSGGSANITSSPMNIGTGDSAGTPQAATGARFTGIAIAGSATINAGTYLEVYKSATAWGVIDGRWYAQAADNAALFSASENMAARARTTANLDINAENINRIDNTWYVLPVGGEFQTLVAEVIARGGWASGNAIVLLCIGDAINYARATFDSYDTTSATAPKLHIEYTAAAGGTEVEVPLATLVITGYAPTVSTPVNVTVPLGTLVITGYAPTAATPTAITVPLATLVVTGYAPSVGWSGGTTVPLSTLVITGYAPTVGWSGGTTVPLATLVITGYTPTVVGVGSVAVEVPLATLVITGYAPSVGWSGGTTVPLATLVITAYVPTAVGVTGLEVEVPVATLVITGLAPTVGWSGGTTPPTASLVITGYAPEATVPGAEAAVVGARPVVVAPLGPPPVDKSFPRDKFIAAIDAEAFKQRSIINTAYDEAEEEAEELKRQARYARDEALEKIEDRLYYVNKRMRDLNQAKSDVRSMQMRPRLEEIRRQKEAPPEPKKPDKPKDRTPKLTKQKLKKVKKGYRK